MHKTSLRFVVAAISFTVLLNGCSNLGYYTQSVRGQLDLLWKREPIEKVVNDPNIPEATRAKLAAILRMRAFASTTLSLPENGSYRSYADLRRDHVVWTVYAAPELATELRTWCFLFAGCVSYRGYFSKEAAETFGAALRADGDDVFVGGVDAYSTLGWFDDPVLNTFIRRSEAELAGLIFHELAHQRLYVKNDTTFNESFARTVELEGVKLWLAHNGTPQQLDAYLADQTHRADFIALVTDARAKLTAIFASTQSAEAKRAEKQRAFEQLKTDYETLKRNRGGYAGYDAWFEHDLNNAKLAAVAAYTDYVAAFQALLIANNNDFAAYYRAAREIGDLPETERHQKLAELTCAAQTVLNAHD